ncbi:MAG TPA: TlyA family RNA methyltransferase [Candidatus Saccharimonadales bacterium]|nr:TlyA family RNA methyltransferase [Candidatus Saccharimonadales bacterium]
MPKVRLDQKLTQLGLVQSRSQAESFIKLGEVKVNGKVQTKPGFSVSETDKVELTAKEQYVSRAALKLSSVAKVLKLDFAGKTVLDVGSSTGGFTDYALQHGAAKVIAVEVGTDQLHPSLRGNPQIELHERTDIRNVRLVIPSVAEESIKTDLSTPFEMTHIHDIPDLVVADVSFISLREILPHVASLSSKQTQIVAMVKPQFEAGQSSLKHKGVIKNDKMRREILKDFEAWAHQKFLILDKADSQVAGEKGNLERFYLLRKA